MLYNLWSGEKYMLGKPVITELSWDKTRDLDLNLDIRGELQGYQLNYCFGLCYTPCRFCGQKLRPQQV